MLFICCFISFLLTSLVTPQVIRLATAYKCIDLPGKRHVHKKATPRWGGIAFFIGVLPALFMLPLERSSISFFAASVIMLTIGMIDDRKTIPYTFKFAGMIAAVTIVIFGGNAIVHDLGTYRFIGQVELGWLSIPFTYFGILGVTNAINLLDGLNGLAAGVSLLAFLFMGIAAAVAGNVALALLCFAYVGALAAFLRYNFPVARIFMGDTGSLFLGFSLSVIAVQLTQNSMAPVNPMFPLLVLLLPIFDTLRVLLLRIMRRRNPFQADKSHLHYLMTRKGLSAVSSVLLIWAMTAIFGVIGLFLMPKTADFSLLFTVYACLVLSFFVISLVRRRMSSRENRRFIFAGPLHSGEQTHIAKARIQ